MSHVGSRITPAPWLVVGMLWWEHLCASPLGTRRSEGARGQPCCTEGCGQRAGRRWPVGRRLQWGAGPRIPGGVLCTHALSRPAMFAQQGASRPGGEGGRPAPTGVPQLQSLSSLPAKGGSLSYFVCCYRRFNKMLVSPGANPPLMDLLSVTRLIASVTEGHSYLWSQPYLMAPRSTQAPSTALFQNQYPTLLFALPSSHDRGVQVTSLT